MFSKEVVIFSKEVVMFSKEVIMLSKEVVMFSEEVVMFWHFRDFFNPYHSSAPHQKLIKNP